MKNKKSKKKSARVLISPAMLDEALGKFESMSFEDKNAYLSELEQAQTCFCLAVVEILMECADFRNTLLDIFVIATLAGVSQKIIEPNDIEAVIDGFETESVAEGDIAGHFAVQPHLSDWFLRVLDTQGFTGESEEQGRVLFALRLMTYLL